jgi:hypothetical protein
VRSNLPCRFCNGAWSKPERFAGRQNERALGTFFSDRSAGFAGANSPPIGLFSAPGPRAFPYPDSSRECAAFSFLLQSAAKRPMLSAQQERRAAGGV